MIIISNYLTSHYIGYGTKRIIKKEYDMNELLEFTYIKTNVSKKWLLQNNFQYSKSLSDDDLEIYTYKFPVHKYKNLAVLTCELSIDINSGIVGINVYDETGNMYNPFYHVECGNYEFLIESINKKIYKELNKLGIKKVINPCK